MTPIICGLCLKDFLAFWRVDRISCNDRIFDLMSILFLNSALFELAIDELVSGLIDRKDNLQNARNIMKLSISNMFVMPISSGSFVFIIGLFASLIR